MLSPVRGIGECHKDIVSYEPNPAQMPSLRSTDRKSFPTRSPDFLHRFLFQTSLDDGNLFPPDLLRPSPKRKTTPSFRTTIWQANHLFHEGGQVVCGRPPSE